MKTISLLPINRRPQIETNKPILEALLAEQVDVMMACGGRGRCATCHVFVEAGMDNLTEMTRRERRTLNRVSTKSDCSRLACQARVQGEGVQVRLPQGLYVTSTEDVLDLVGKRSKQDILHPITGRILVESGKIVTRTYISQLKDIEVDLDAINLASD